MVAIDDIPPAELYREALSLPLKMDTALAPGTPSPEEPSSRLKPLVVNQSLTAPVDSGRSGGQAMRHPRCPLATALLHAAALAGLWAIFGISTAAATGGNENAEPQGALGRFENPVRCDMPTGEREYLLRLRCLDGNVPEIGDRASFGRGPYGNIVDGYEVRCLGEGTHRVFMDMYHRGHREKAAAEGFTVLPELPARAAVGCPPEVPGSPRGYVFNPLEVDFPARPPRGALEVESPGAKGEVRARLIVLASGRADRSSIEIVGAMHEELRPLALALLEKLKFQPAEHRLGCRVPQTVELAIDFH